MTVNARATAVLGTRATWPMDKEHATIQWEEHVTNYRMGMFVRVMLGVGVVLAFAALVTTKRWTTVWSGSD